MEASKKSKRPFSRKHSGLLVLLRKVSIFMVRCRKKLVAFQSGSLGRNFKISGGTFGHRAATLKLHFCQKYFVNKLAKLPRIKKTLVDGLKVF